MITRIWHGITRAAHADLYLEYLQQTGMRDYTATPGNISAKIWRRREGDICHFYTVSEWKDLDSIMQFAGADFEKAKYYEEDKNFLLEKEEKVQHYETYYTPEKQQP